MPSHSYETIYQIKKTITMAQKLAKKDEEFSSYVGGDPRISETIALIDTVLNENMVTGDSVKTLQMFRGLLIRKNKALFASMSSELSKLSFYLGLEDDTISATSED